MKTETTNPAEIPAIAGRLGTDLAHCIIGARAQHVPPLAVAESINSSFTAIRTGFGKVWDDTAVAELQSQIVKVCAEELERTQGHVVCCESETEHTEH